MLLKRLDESYNHLNNVESRIEEALVKFQVPNQQIDSLPGISITAASSVIAEISSDMSNFKTADHICSWA